MSNGVLPKLMLKYKLPYIIHKTLITYGLRESDMSERLKPFERELPEFIKLAYLPNYRRLRLRLTAKGDNKLKLEEEVAQQVTKLMGLLEDITVGFENFVLESEIGKLLVKNKQTLATAESFTGGKMASVFTKIPGASQYFKGGIVAYSAELKKQELQVSEALIKQHSVVSAEVAEAMAIGAKIKFNTDYAIATTGNAGPTTDITDRSIGDVYIAIATPIEVYSTFFNLGQPREKVIYRGVSKALEILFKEIQKNDAE
jgi:nicotinamide-nucleotide amidase